MSKRVKSNESRVEMRPYAVDEAITTLKDCAKATKFEETVEVAVRLGVDARKSDQMVRGAMVLPHGTGRDVRIAVFAQGDQAKAAEAAGADRVGHEDLAEEIKKGQCDYDVVIATPDTMALVGKLGQILGPKGLMPNPKVGTVSMDVGAAVKNAKSGQVQFRTEKAGIVHTILGKSSFDAKALKENLEALLKELKRVKPAASKGIYLKKVVLSTTMGPGVEIDLSSLAL